MVPRCLVVGLKPCYFLPANFRPNLSQELHVSVSLNLLLVGDDLEKLAPLAQSELRADHPIWRVNNLDPNFTCHVGEVGLAHDFPKGPDSFLKG